MTIAVKRVYDPPAPDDGLRLLVDRLWPRGLTKAAARLDGWPKALAPSDGLRKWYNHEAPKWEEFKRRYFAELAQQQEALAELRAQAKGHHITLLFSSRELERNNAVALKEFLQHPAGHH